MTMDNNTTNSQMESESSIDILSYIRTLWAERKLIFKAAGIAMVLGIVIAFTTPKSYTVHMILAPETSKGASGSLASAASMLGLGNLSMGNDVDALKVTIYPEIVASTPFIIDLFDTQVQTLKGNETMALTDYLKTTRQSLVSTIISLPFKVLGKIMSLFRSDEEGADIVTSVDPFHLTKPQAMAASALRRQIQTFVDKKTGITTINVTMQDPKVAAMVADVVITNLKEYITKYRISKAADDCKYWEEIYEKRKEEYYQAQKNFADYSDANRNVVLQSVLNERERLHNEKALALQLYTSVATQMQMARAKVQEAKPVFEVVEPATIPRKSSGTSRSMTIMVFIFLGAASASGWILFGRDLFKKLKN